MLSEAKHPRRLDGADTAKCLKALLARHGEAKCGTCAQLEAMDVSLRNMTSPKTVAGQTLMLFLTADR
jgi:hypothetical protein